MQISSFLPRRSESLPKTGINIARETEKPAKITPSQIPVAPRFSAYSGRSGAIMPTPSMEEKMDRDRMGKIFFIIRICVSIIAF